MPSSIAAAPPRAKARSSGTVASSPRCPAVTKGTRPAWSRSRSARRRASSGDKESSLVTRGLLDARRIVGLEAIVRRVRRAQSLVLQRRAVVVIAEAHEAVGARPPVEREVLYEQAA